VIANEGRGYDLYGGYMLSVKRAFQVKALVFLLFISVSLPVYGVDVINNPGKPQNSINAGRVATFKVSLRIDDRKGGYYFKTPRNIKVAKDGSIFVIDKKQFLKFNREGKFIRNFFKYGQGPGEVLNIRNYNIIDNQLHIHDSAQNKIIVLDHINGEKLKEFRFHSAGSVIFIFYNNTDYYFYKTDSPQTGGKVKFIDLDAQLLKINSPGDSVETIFTFQVKFLVIRTGDRYFNSARARFIVCPLSEDILLFSHTPEYEIKVFDLKSCKVLKRFKRTYQRVAVTEATRKYTPGGGIEKFSLDGTTFIKMPGMKYLLDIQKLLIVNNKIWVVTSTVKDSNKVLVDVYDKDFLYVDNFFLECPPEVSPYSIKFWLVGTDGDSIFLVQENEEGDKYIEKVQVQ
jgi:hypothetical protein